MPMPPQPYLKVVRILFGTFGLVFFGAGFTLIIAIWSGGMGSPPLFFRIFATLIAIPFLVVGGTIAYAAFLGKLPDRLSRFKRPTNRRGNPPTDYTCPGCGAELAAGDDVSPHGDAKCKFCNTWFNIHA